MLGGVPERQSLLFPTPSDSAPSERAVGLQCSSLPLDFILILDDDSALTISTTTDDYDYIGHTNHRRASGSTVLAGY